MGNRIKNIDYNLNIVRMDPLIPEAYSVNCYVFSHSKSFGSFGSTGCWSQDCYLLNQGSMGLITFRKLDIGFDFYRKLNSYIIEFKGFF